MKHHSDHGDEMSASRQARDLYERGHHSVKVTGPDGKESHKWASADMATKKSEKDWQIEKLDKMNKPHGTLQNGKQYFLQAHHPAHKTFTAQEHAEAAKKLHEAGVKMFQQGHDDDDGFGINHGRNLAIAAKAHAEKAKSMGLPAHNHTPKR